MSVAPEVKAAPQEAASSVPRIETLWPSMAVNRHAHAMVSLAHQMALKDQLANELYRPFVPKTSQVVCSFRDTSSGAMRLMLPDSVTGRRLCVISSSTGNPAVPSLITAAADDIPSRQRIHAVALIGDASPVVADSCGSVYLWRSFLSDLQEDAMDAEEAAVSNRKGGRRLEGTEANAAAGRTQQLPHSNTAWASIVSSAATLPSRGAFPSYGALGGWVGLTAATSSTTHAVVGREHFMDLRQIDIATGTIVQQYKMSHAPTGMCGSAELHSHHDVVVAEGPLVSLYDLRAPTRVAAHRQSFPSGRVNNVCRVSNSTHLTAVCCADRSVSIWDTRSWGRHVKLYANVLKHAAMNVATAPIPSQPKAVALVCSGVDSEVRVLRFAEADAAPSGTTKKQSTTAPTTTTDATPAVSTFRSRIDEAVHCDTTWLGGWTPVPPQQHGHKDPRTTLLVGVSVSNDFYAVACGDLVDGGGNDSQNAKEMGREDLSV